MIQNFTVYIKITFEKIHDYLKLLWKFFMQEKLRQRIFERLERRSYKLLCTDWKIWSLNRKYQVLYQHIYSWRVGDGPCKDAYWTNMYYSGNCHSNSETTLYSMCSVTSVRFHIILQKIYIFFLFVKSEENVESCLYEKMRRLFVST